MDNKKVCRVCDKPSDKVTSWKEILLCDECLSWLKEQDKIEPLDEEARRRL